MANIWPAVTAIAAILAVAVSVMNHYSIQAVHVIINSRLDTWIKTAQDLAYNLGRKHGREENSSPGSPAPS